MNPTRHMNAFRFKDGVAYMHIDCAARGFCGETQVDVADIEKLLAFGLRWRAAWFTEGGLRPVATVGPRGHRKMLLLTRFLMDTPSGLFVDHINHDPLDNRRANLRVCTPSQNGQNRKGAASNSQSGIRGVVWYPYTRKWKAQVGARSADGTYKMKHLGYFATIEEADRAAQAGRAKHMTHSKECAPWL